MQWFGRFLKRLWTNEGYLMGAVVIFSILGLGLTGASFFVSNRIYNDDHNKIFQKISDDYFVQKQDAFQLSLAIDYYVENITSTPVLLKSEWKKFQKYLAAQTVQSYSQMVNHGLGISDEEAEKSASLAGKLNLNELDKNEELVNLLFNRSLKNNSRLNILFFLLFFSQILNLMLEARLSYLSLKSSKMNGVSRHLPVKS